MGKRSDYEKREKDQYLTPVSAVKPLIPFLPVSFNFSEPCAGDGRLANHIEKLSSGKCTQISDIDPELVLKEIENRGEKACSRKVEQKDALTLNALDVENCDLIITNPPWTRTKASGYILHKMIEHFSGLKDTWLLFDSDWPHTLQSTPYMKYCTDIVSVGRVKWIEGSGMSGKDNCAWYKFSKDNKNAPKFWGRGILPA